MTIEEISRFFSETRLLDKDDYLIWMLLKKSLLVLEKDDMSAPISDKHWREIMQASIGLDICKRKGISPIILGALSTHNPHLYKICSL